MCDIIDGDNKCKEQLPTIRSDIAAGHMYPLNSTTILVLLLCALTMLHIFLFIFCHVYLSLDVGFCVLIFFFFKLT